MLYDNTKNDKENKDIIQSFMYILASFIIGDNAHKLFFIIIGEPNTGKSTLLDFLLGLFSSYGTTFNNSALLLSPRTANDIRPDLIAFIGKRLLVGSEANKEGKFDNALVKQISGNDQISVRKPHKGEMINFTVKGKLLLVTNFCPKFSDLDDEAFLNRIVLIDFNNKPKQIDTTLKEKLLTPRSRDEIFSYLVRKACIIVKSKTIFIHERFTANKQRILINQNSTVSLFWKAHIRPYKAYSRIQGWMHKHPVKVLYTEMYCDFCEKAQLKPEKLEEFAKQFKVISDASTMATLKRGASNNFYMGFEVVDGNSAKYYKFINMNMLDKSSPINNNDLFS
jgi:phage/plasmid-associated DNA primase